MMDVEVLILGSGPAGQKAAIQAAKEGKVVAIVEAERNLGGHCVHRGTIPSKTLRETAVQLDRLRHVAPDIEAQSGANIAALLQNVNSVIDAHVSFMTDQLERNGVARLHGRASFRTPREVEVMHLGGTRTVLKAETIVIATGSVPRDPEGIPIDHEHILDSDSILSMTYLPESLIVLGGGVIACEYASIFAKLGIDVTIVDSSPRPLRFMDEELVERFLHNFMADGNIYVPEQRLESVCWDGESEVKARLEDGREISAQKMFVALGRVANTRGLRLEKAGLEVSKRGHIVVNAHLQTAQPHIYAVGDVIGPPGLASSAMEQGRRAMRHALGMRSGDGGDLVPVGIYTIPEMASVGLNEEEVIEAHGDCVVGRARFDEVARGQISGMTDGLLKLVAGPEGRRLLGVQIVGDSATELIHIGQMAIMGKHAIDEFVNNTFNFPTLAEAYRIAALDLLARAAAKRAKAEEAA